MWRTHWVGRLLRAYIGPATLGVLLGWAVAPLPAQAPPAAAPALSETQRLKAENLRLRFVLLQQEEQRLREAVARLEEERVALEAAFRQTLKASPGQTFNWQTLSFDSAPTGAASSPIPTGATPAAAPAPTNGAKPPPGE